MGFGISHVLLLYNSVDFSHAELILSFVTREIWVLAHTVCSRPNATSTLFNLQLASDSAPPSIIIMLLG